MSKATGRTRVLHVVHSLQCGGAEVLVRDLIAQRGGDVHFEVLSLSGDGPLAADIESLGGIVHRYERTPGFDRGCSKAIARIVQRNTIDIIHAHQYSPWVYAALARLHGAWRAKVIYTEHGRPYPDARKGKRVIANRLALLPLSHRVTVVSGFIGRALQRYEAIPDRRIELIYNGIDQTPMLSQRDDERPALRQALGIGDDDVMVLQVAGFRPIKDHATVIRAMSHLQASHPNVRLVLAGDGQTLADTRHLVTELGLNEQVQFLGLRDDVASLWHAADIGLLSSRSEGTSVAIMEAMAAAKPIVTTDVGGNPELVQQQVTGLLTPRGDAPAMAHALATLADNAEMRQTMGDAGRRRICESFTQKQMHDRFCQLYRELTPRQSTDGDSLIVFADDFGRHPSSMQHLVGHLAEHRSIVWVNTIGMRRPRLCWADAKRAAAKVGRWLMRNTQPAAVSTRTATHRNIRVINPIMWPSFAGPIQRWINRRLLRRAVARAAKRLPGAVQAITALPITADLADTPGIADWTYYMVDDFATWPGNDGKALAEMDRKQLAWIDRIIAVSDVLADHAARYGAKAKTLTHGIDIDRWQSQPTSDLADRIAALPGPRAVFWGLIDERLDVEAIRRLTEYGRCRVVLVGPTQGDVAALLATPGVTYFGPAAHAELPAIAAAADVLIMPYRDLPVTRAMQPLKLKEYLATGRPVVCLPLPALREWADACDVVSGEAFVDRVRQRADQGLPPAQLDARRRLESETWQAKAARFENILTDRTKVDEAEAA